MYLKYKYSIFIHSFIHSVTRACFAVWKPSKNTLLKILTIPNIMPVVHPFELYGLCIKT